jgi:hypothetical protein
MRSLLLLYPAGLLLGFAVGAGCSSFMPSHCANLDGDKTCATRGGGSFCDMCRVDGDECVETRPSDDCYHPRPADESSTTGDNETTSSNTTLEPTTESAETIMGSMPCVDHEGCPDAAAPFCEPSSGQCVACNATSDPDAACEGLDPSTPVCVGDQCMECSPENPVACDEQLLLCDGASNTCVGCDEHEQCESGACELAVGRCFPPDVVVHVDGDGGRDFPSIVAAVDAVENGGIGVIVVHERNGDASYQDHLVVDAGKTIALLAATGEQPLIQSLMNDYGLRVEGTGTALYMDGLGVRSNPLASSGRGLEVDGALAWIDRSRIVQNMGGGILAENDAELTLRNCFVAGNGYGDPGSFGIEVLDSKALVLYTTVARNDGSSIDSIRCMGGLVDVRNSIIVGRDAGSIECPGIAISNSALDENIAGDDNENVGATISGWFLNVNDGDFHLTGLGSATFAGIARWRTGDPRTDIDGDPRPTQDGAEDHAGADIPTP